MTFKDHFSKQSQGYTRYRPDYPQALFQWLASESPRTSRAWDCATGNGQAAVALAQHFDMVDASDASHNQISHGKSHPKVRYFTATAEDSGLESNVMDLVTVAQAIHWFKFQAFFNEARRVLKPDGVLAFWGYGLLRITPEVDQVVDRFYGETLEAFWPPERRYIENGYRDVPFPFHQMTTPEFTMKSQWSCADLTGYLRTWSAVVRYRDRHGVDPVDALEPLLTKAWGQTPEKQVLWPVHLKAGRKETSL